MRSSEATKRTFKGWSVRLHAKVLAASNVANSRREVRVGMEPIISQGGAHDQNEGSAGESGLGGEGPVSDVNAALAQMLRDPR